MHVTVMPTDDDKLSLLEPSGTVMSSLESFLPTIGTIMAAIGAIIMLFGVIRVFASYTRAYPQNYGEGWSTVVMGGLTAATGLFLPAMVTSLMGALFDDAEVEESPTPTPTPTGSETPSASPSPTVTPSASPAPEAAPLDLTWLAVVFGVIGALIAAVLLVWLIVAASTRARRGVRKAREEAAAAREAAERLAATWQAVRDRHAELLRKIVHAETDWDTLFSMPALSDSSVPQTYAMLRAMRAASNLRDTAGELPSGLGPTDDVTELPYPRAVEAFALAWEAAERHARRVGQKGVPLAERKAIREIRTLLDMAENSAASQNERTLAYRRAQKLIESLESVHVPERAFAQLEERRALMITAD